MVLCGHACVCACTHACFFSLIAYDLDASKSYVCFSMSILMKINLGAWKYAKSFEVLYVQSFDTYPLWCPHFTISLCCLFSARPLVIYNKEFATSTLTNRALMHLE